MSSFSRGYTVDQSFLDSNPKVELAMLSLFIASSFSPRYEDCDAFLTKMRNAYHGVHSALFFVHFSATDQRGALVKGEVRYEYSAPNLLRAAFKGIPDGPAILFCDGKTFAVFGSSGKRQMFPYSAPALASHLPTNVETLAFFNGDKALSRNKGCEMEGSELTLEEKEWKSKHWHVLRETNKQDQVQVDYYVDPKTMLIWRTLGIDLKTHKPFIDAEVLELDTQVRLDANRFKIPSKNP